MALLLKLIFKLRYLFRLELISILLNFFLFLFKQVNAVSLRIIKWFFLRSLLKIKLVNMHFSKRIKFIKLMPICWWRLKTYFKVCTKERGAFSKN
ncbi:unnamed protein product [Blepharisma stoltei]|uniref:Uncharacterized protein n=1 Tax=Blepharisma stoltei TaxID=1481888 RepID=A0AAU9ITB8_9CILI|nr:unnamed protein product [Blepharisma stoltei]